MCGIAGYIERHAPPDGTAERMTARLAHRGPDGGGVWHSRLGPWHVALGHRRLAIIDVAGGRQPLSNETGDVWITYNGEVYDFPAAREQLARLGHRFETRCDTEVIVHHYEEYGPAGLVELNGMFACAVWDARGRDEGELLLARDRAGIKPLYYADLPGGGIAFASELSALLEHPGVDATLDPVGLASYFFSDYAAPPHTLVRGARKLRPGHYLLWRDGAIVRDAPFWRPPPPAARDAAAGAAGGAVSTPESEGTLIRQIRETLDAAVGSQLVSDVPLGVFLSGGIDSSLVAALAQRHCRGLLTTFSMGFSDAEFDESPYALAVAAHLETRHVERVFGEADLLDRLDDCLSCLDEPMADPSILPTYLLSELAASHVKVVLGGDGGDELWGGYPTYKAHGYARWYARVPRVLRKAVIEPLVAGLPVRHGYQPLEWKAKRFALRWADQPAERHLRWMSNVDLPDLAQALSQVRSPLPVLKALPGTANGPAVPGGDWVDDVILLDFATYLPGSILTKVDRAAMAHGLEVRPPMLDNAMIDLALSVPAATKLKGGVGKWPLKAAAEGLVPEQIIRRPKRGFAIPLARWVAGPLLPRLRDLLAASPLWDTGLLNRDAFARWLDEHLARKADRSRPLWALLVLDHWHRSILSRRQMGTGAPLANAV